jgi:hypothetical protein
MKLIKVKHLKLDNPSFLQFLKQFVALINKYDAGKLKVITAAAALIAIFASLQAALDKEKSNELTQLLNKLDRHRDVLITAFVKFLESMTDFPDATLAAKAKTLLHYVDGFGKGIAYQNQLAETTILTNIVDGFTTNIERKNSLAAINGTPWITAIGAVNTEYAAQYGNRVTDDSATKNVESFTSVRKKALVLYNALAGLLESRYESDKADNLDVSLYETCMKDLNELITKVNTLGNSGGGTTTNSNNNITPQ